MQVTDKQLETIIRAIVRQNKEMDQDAFWTLLASALKQNFSIQQRGEDIDNYVVPQWLGDLAYQQQSVVLLALRGPDGIRKHHPAKTVHIAYRATILRAAERQRFLEWGEEADSFMSMHVIADDTLWEAAVKAFFDHVDELPHHYVSHLAHAAQIIGYKHPDDRMRRAWGYFYYRWVDDAHLEPEPETVMDRRLGDWGTAQARLGLRGIPFAVDFGIEATGLPEKCGCSSCRDEQIECIAVSDPAYPTEFASQADGVAGE
jgi:hypothetical protein